MQTLKFRLSNTFNQFFDSGKSSSMLLVVFTLVSLIITNSSFYQLPSLGEAYLSFWHRQLGALTVEHWINDGFMAIFFLLIGLELEREVYSGELANIKAALLPIFAAFGGMLAPALIHFAFNAGTETQAGIGIPMATDIAFALGILAILSNRIPPALKVFLVAFAVIDDLGAAILIAVFYTSSVSLAYLTAAIGLWLLLVLLNRLRVMSLAIYLVGGVFMWVLMLKSGVHATLAGIALAFAIPFSHKAEDAESPSHKLEHFLHKPVAFVILPIFALANTGVTVSPHWFQDIISHNNSWGIIAGLVFGKPIGVVMFCLLAVMSGLCVLPIGVKWRHIIGAGLLGGIGFTMSIFVTNLAFVGQLETINQAKMSILLASLTAGLLGYIWLRCFTPNNNTSAAD
jgi:NhaA family Na+:H+ antiporter